MGGLSAANGISHLMADLLVTTLDQTKALIAAGQAIEIQQQAQAVAIENLGENIDIVA